MLRRRCSRRSWPSSKAHIHSPKRRSRLSRQATQSLADIEKSAIAPAIIESCPTRLFLPNERAIEPQIMAIYRRFGLNDRPIEILARATPKRDYYCQSRRGNRCDDGPPASENLTNARPRKSHRRDRLHG
jgi:hypothetical protein